MIRGTENQGTVPEGDTRRLVDVQFRFGAGFASPASEVRSQSDGRDLSSLSAIVRVRLGLFPSFSSASVFAAGGKKAKLLAVGRQANSARLRFPLVRGAGFAAVCPHGVDLLLIIRGLKGKRARWTSGG